MVNFREPLDVSNLADFQEKMSSILDMMSEIEDSRSMHGRGERDRTHTHPLHLIEQCAKGGNYQLICKNKKNGRHNV